MEMSIKSKIIAGIVVLLLLVAGGLYVFSGTQYVTKRIGGTTTIELPEGKKLVPYTVQWEPKGSHIWYLTEDAEPGYKPKEYSFHESSNLGMLEGTIIFKER
ncbi:hypothetical protein [Anaerovibrio sp.]|uniref:hypothetical protein n=2 Tax=Anaerovibrio TaxID=82373 RepID=UPI0025BDA622|nr:hypothetical protein [Anaerovibrio sp.]MBR2143414.1 hypothetical protein [Anaerovibrio sp.]